jgi:hypothetical protein
MKILCSAGAASSRFGVAVVLSLGAAIAHAGTYYTGFDADTNLIDLGEGLDVHHEKVGPCFSIGQNDRVKQKSSNATYTITIEDESTNVSSSSALSTEISAGGKYEAGIAAASANVSSRFSTADEENRDERILGVVLNVFSQTEREYASNTPLNSRGEMSKTSAADIIKNCGYLVANDVYRAIRVQTKIYLRFESASEKHSATEALEVAIGGRYQAFSGSASYGQQLDTTLASQHKSFKVNVVSFVRAKNGIQSFALLTQQLQQLEQKPFESVILAISAQLGALSQDEGAVDRVELVPTDQWMPQFSLIDWQLRARAIDRVERLEKGLRLLGAMRVGRPFAAQPPDLTYRQFHLRGTAWLRMCCKPGTVCDQYWVQPTYRIFEHDDWMRDAICNDDVDIDGAERRLFAALSRCLAGNEAFPELCSVKPLRMAVYDPMARVVSFPVRFDNSA